MIPCLEHKKIGIKKKLFSIMYSFTIPSGNNRTVSGFLVKSLMNPPGSSVRNISSFKCWHHGLLYRRQEPGSGEGLLCCSDTDVAWPQHSAELIWAWFPSLYSEKGRPRHLL